MRLRGSREPKAVTLSAGCCSAALLLQAACIALGEYLLTRIGRPRKVQPDTKAVPSLLTKSTTICWLLCLGLAYPHLTSACPLLISGERESVSLCISVSCCCAQFRDYLLSPRITTTQVQTPHRGPPLPSHPSPSPPSSLLPPTNTTITITITTTTTGRHYSLTRAPSLMPSLLVPPCSSPDAAQRHSARS